MEVPQAMVRRGLPTVRSTAFCDPNWSSTADFRAHQDGPEYDEPTSA
jgi:hypothetical protein